MVDGIESECWPDSRRNSGRFPVGIVAGFGRNTQPVILEPDTFVLWMDPEEQKGDVLKALLHPADSETLTMYPVSTFVNKATNEGERCIEPVKEQGWCSEPSTHS